MKIMLWCGALLVASCRLVTAADQGIMVGAFIPPVEQYTASIRSFDLAAGKTHTHTMFFCKFDFNGIGAHPYLCNQIRDAGKVPVVTWQPGIDGKPDPSFSFDSFLRGDHDGAILNMARQCMEFGDPIIIRFAHEMNISSSPAWPGHSWNGGDTEKFKAMWRYVHRTFDEAGADNVFWAWSPNYMGSAEGLATFSNFNNLYPGDDWVDIIGVSGLNYGNHPTAGPRMAVSAQWLFIPILRDLMAGSYNPERLAVALRALPGTGKPQAIFEFGSVGATPYIPGSTTSTIPKEDWITQSYDALAHTEEFGFVRLILWYNSVAASGNIPSDFRVAQNVGLPEPPVPPSWTDAYRRAVSDPVFLDSPRPMADIQPGDYLRAPSLPRLESYPQHEFWLSVYPGGGVRKGSTISAAFFLHPPINPTPANWGTDAYVAAQIPTGEWYAFVWPGQWRQFSVAGAAYPPAAKQGLDVKREVQGMAFVQGLGAGLPTGTYTLYSILAPRGTDPRNMGPDLKTTTFVLND